MKFQKLIYIENYTKKGTNPHLTQPHPQLNGAGQAKFAVI